MVRALAFCNWVLLILINADVLDYIALLLCQFNVNTV